MPDHIARQAQDAEWPGYRPGCCAVFPRDPGGRNVEAVHHG